MTLPPGPRTSAVVQTYRFVTGMYPWFEEIHREFGDIFTIKLLGVGNSVHVCRPEGVRELMIAAPEEVHAGDSNKIIEPLVGGSSVALVDEKAHQRMRRILNGPLSGTRMRAHGTTIRDATLHAIRNFRVGEQHEMLRVMYDISLEVILRVVFGIKEREQLPAASKAIIDVVTAYNPALLLIKPLRRDLGPHSPGGRFLRRREAIDRWLLREIAARRRTVEPDANDVLGALAQMRDEDGQPLSVREIRDQLMTMFVAGQDTTSSSLAWALTHLHANPELLARAEAEVDALGSDPDPEALSELPYITAICNEALRVIPTVPAASRTPVGKPFRLQGYDIPPGVYMSPNIYLCHNNPEVFAKPQRFNPDRFLERKYSPYEFLPFGGGSRRCIGMPLGFYEMRIVLAVLLQHLRMEAVIPGVPKPRFRGMVLVPEHFALLKVRELRRRGYSQFGAQRTTTGSEAALN